jgi:hypothetical protein
MKTGKLIVLEAKDVRYFSENDESLFFSWLDKISCITSYKGKGDTLFIKVTKERVNEASLREIIALFYRYGISMKQLSIFDSQVFSWLKNKESYWRKNIWPTGSRK